MRRPARALPCLFLLSLGAVAQETRAPESFQLGLGMQQRGMYEEAGKYFAEFLRAAGGSEPARIAEANYRLGSCQAELGQRKPAIASLQKALQLAEPLGNDGFRWRAECRYRLGQALKEEGQLPAAAAQFAAMAHELPADHYLLAGARYAEGECWRDGSGEARDDGKAIAAFTAAAAAATGKQASFRFPSLYQLGFAQLRSGAFAAAGQSFQDAVAAAPDEAAKGECLWLAGDAALRGKDLDAAQQRLTAAARAGGEFADDAALGLAWVAVERGDAARAQQQFRAVIEQYADSPLAPRARLELGRLQYRDKKFADAAASLQPLLASEDAALQQQARELSGLCALELGHGDQALEQLRAAAASAAPADQPRLCYALGEALANQQQWADAVAAYDRVPTEAPVDLRGDALYGACFALHQLGKFDDSSRRADAVRKLQPAHRLAGQATFAIGENLFAQQHYGDAQREFAALAAAADAPGDLKAKAEWKLAWCGYLQAGAAAAAKNGDAKAAAAGKAAAAERFAAIAQQEQSPFREEALSMQALALWETEQFDAALQAADTYRTRFSKGTFLDRTERVAARVLQKRGDLAAAQKRLERAAAAAKGADASADRLEQAELCFQRGDFKQAQQIYAKLVEAPESANDRTGARALEGLAWCAFELGDDAQCQQRIEQGLQHPQVGDLAASLLELQSSLFHRQQNWAQAIATAQQFLAKFAQHRKAPALRYALGVAQARSGDQKAARATLAALNRDGGHARMDRVRYELAWACRRDNDEAAALAAFAQVAADTQDAELRGEANLHLGTAALAQKDETKGRDLLGKVEGKWQARALYQLGFLDLGAAAGNGAENADGAPATGEAAAKLARAKAAFAAVAAMPGEALAPEAGFLVGECCFRLGDQAGASAQYRALLQQAPEHERAQLARLHLGECAVALGKPDDAVPALEQFLRTAGNGADAGKLDAGAKAELARGHLLLGRARLARKEHDRAEAAFAKVTELSDGPLAAEAQFRLGESRAARGDLNGAADAFAKLSILYAHEEWVRRGLLQVGLCYEQLQQPQKARRFFEELVQRFAASPEGREAQSHLQNAPSKTPGTKAPGDKTPGGKTPGAKAQGK